MILRKRAFIQEVHAVKASELVLATSDQFCLSHVPRRGVEGSAPLWSPRQVAVPDITEAVKGAKVLVFVIPHQFISSLCDQMKPHIVEGTIGISLIKVRSRLHAALPFQTGSRPT